VRERANKCPPELSSPFRGSSSMLPLQIVARVVLSLELDSLACVVLACSLACLLSIEEDNRIFFARPCLWAREREAARKNSLSICCPPPTGTRRHHCKGEHAAHSATAGTCAWAKSLLANLNFRLAARRLYLAARSLYLATQSL